jgi:phosphopantetheinyl transferase
MSPIRSEARRIVNSFADDRSGQEHGVRQRTSCERRSATRPIFIEGWQKPVARHFVPASQAVPIRSKNKIEIWVASIDGLFGAKSCMQLLTDKDWTFLVRIQDPANRNSAISARVLLRLGLSRATDRTIAPAQWDFSTNAQQRPIVADGFPKIHYSVSHIDQLAVVAVSTTLNVGIDVESIDQDVTDDVMAEFCHLDERRSLRGLSYPQKVREFIRLWTLKEAYSKMVGLGHSLDFKTLRFMLDPINLAPTGDEGPVAPVRFENFYVSINHTLFHTSLAIEGGVLGNSSNEVQIISLVDSAMGAAFAAPSCI